MSESGVSTTAVIGDPGSWGQESERTVRWRDPASTIALGATLSGLEYMTAIRDGQLPAPPIAATVGMHFTDVRAGEVIFRCTPDGSLLNPIGSVHGGLHCTLLDSVMGCATHTTLAAGVGYTTIELKISFMRAVQPGDELIAHGWVTKPGRRVAFAEGSIKTADDKLIATGSSSLLVMGA